MYVHLIIANATLMLTRCYIMITKKNLEVKDTCFVRVPGKCKKTNIHIEIQFI